jgi:hypothetical protein
MADPSESTNAPDGLLAFPREFQAHSRDTDRNDRGGFRVGPMGQEFPGANPVFHPSMRHEHRVYAYVPGYRIPPRHWGWEWDRY